MQPDRAVLMVAFHFPPFGGSSGARRTLALCRYLPSNGWRPLVLTAHQRAYDQIVPGAEEDIPSGLFVRRAQAFDAARHLSFRGRYPASLGVPDRWRAWQPFAVREGLAMAREFRPQAIWVTYPLASSLSIALQLANRLDLPLVADMRDPMVETDPLTGIEYPTNARIRTARLKIEADVVRVARSVVFCTESSRQICANRYGPDAARRFFVVPNGFEPEPFESIERDRSSPAPRSGFVLLHSGTVYPGDDRGPESLFAALADLRDRGALPGGFELRLRATGNDAAIAAIAQRFQVSSLVTIAPPRSYIDALREMMDVDALLLLQGAASNPAIPAKLYEYMRARRPIVALVHPDGESAKLLAALNGAAIARLDHAEEISSLLERFFAEYSAGTARTVSAEEVERYSRRSQVGSIAQILRSVTGATFSNS